jgi:hypothetical protein
VNEGMLKTARVRRFASSLCAATFGAGEELPFVSRIQTVVPFLPLRPIDVSAIVQKRLTKLVQTGVRVGAGTHGQQ